MDRATHCHADESLYKCIFKLGWIVLRTAMRKESIGICQLGIKKQPPGRGGCCMGMGEDYSPLMAATPGRTLPSMASRRAPPPVDT